MFQGSQGIAAKVINARCMEAVNDTQIPPAAASSYAQQTNRKRPCTALTVDDELESRKNDAAFDVKRTRPSLNAMAGQVTQGVVAPVHNPEFAEVVYETQVPSAATSFCAQPPAPKRPCRESPRVVVPTPSIENLQTMRTARQRSYFNCVIGVLDNGNHTILRVWDGTKPSRSLARHPQAQPITVDSALEASVHDCAVDIVCWDDHARSAKALKPHDKVSLLNVHAYVNKSGVEVYTMHGGAGYGRCIRRLQIPQLVERLEK
ncbi:hypothetical protein AAVH_29370 [Aphelenchoides avenae]|nr:hypothetical protein AAVH_29370 [Aphelenchus avenae]